MTVRYRVEVDDLLHQYLTETSRRDATTMADTLFKAIRLYLQARRLVGEEGLALGVVPREQRHLLKSELMG